MAYPLPVPWRIRMAYPLAVPWSIRMAYPSLGPLEGVELPFTCPLDTLPSGCVPLPIPSHLFYVLFHYYNIIIISLNFFFC